MNLEQIRIEKERTIWLICTAISFLLWVFVKLSKEYETLRVIHVEYRLPPGKEFAEQPPAQLRATVSAHGWDLLSSYFSRRNSLMVIDLTKQPLQEIQKDDLLDRAAEATGMKVKELSKGHISLATDYSFSRKVPVRLEKDLAFAPDFFLRDSVLLIPDSITISGAAALLEGVEYVSTERIELNELRTEFRQKVAIKAPSQGAVNLFPGEVEVFIPVEQFTEKKIKVPVTVRGASNQVQVFPASVELRCVVGLSHFEALNENDFRLEADLSGIAGVPDADAAPLNLVKSPQWVKSVQFSPKSVGFFIIQ